MNIILYNNFSKRKNSTKRPSGGSSVDVKLKENTSLENPTFILSTPISGATYVHVPEWGEYYFVTDCVNLNAGQCELVCECDPMANLRSAIASTEAYVLYDTTANTEIPDTRLATKVKPTVAQNNETCYAKYSKSGNVVATVTGDEQTQVYLLPTSDIIHLVPNSEQMVTDYFVNSYTPAAGNDLDALGQNLFQMIKIAITQGISSGHISENIQDVRWIPFDFTSGITQQVKIGQYLTTLNATPLDYAYRIYNDSVTIQIPWQFNDWRDTDPYTQIYVRIPYIGLVSFPASSLVGQSAITMNYALDVISGDLAVELISGNQVLGSYGGSTAVKIPIGNSATNVANIMNALMSLPVSALGGPQSVAAAASNSILSMFTPLTQTVGGISSAAFTGLDNKIRCITVCHDTVITPSSVSDIMGTPTMEKKTLGSLSGYIKCQDASVNAICRKSEREVVDGYLNSGFFFE